MCITRMPEGSMTLKKKKELALAGEGREDLMYLDTAVVQAPGLLRVARLNLL